MRRGKSGDLICHREFSDLMENKDIKFKSISNQICKNITQKPKLK